jgi:hypothetical protein
LAELTTKPHTHTHTHTHTLLPTHYTHYKNLSFTTSVAFQALNPSHLRRLSHLKLSKYAICDPCRTSGFQALSFATPVALQIFKIFIYIYIYIHVYTHYSSPLSLYIYIYIYIHVVFE